MYVTPSAKRWHTSSFSILAHNMKVIFLATAENWIIFPFIIDILYLDYRRHLISIFRCAFWQFCSFPPPFLYLGDEQGTG